MASIELELIGIKCFGLETLGLLGVDVGRKMVCHGIISEGQKDLAQGQETKEVNAARSMNEAFLSLKGKS